MKYSSIVVLSFLCAVCLVGCEHEASTAEQAVKPSANAEPSSAGGYEPSADERVPGITMSQEELDKIYAEARRNMPLPVIPEDAR
ncbi:MULTISPECIES: hypothetical protein [unclassified Methylophilus]|uniref:hypothetical protein n=1 Tax=unclassified Methylophilus TaxID=2630143 RepID=UPI0003790504|nr:MULTISPECIES: hypothetical protein [unclassified Methylophilus]